MCSVAVCACWRAILPQRADASGCRRLDHEAALYRLGLWLVTRAHERRRQGAGGAGDAGDGSEAEWVEGQRCLRKAGRLGHLEARFSLGALILGQLVEEALQPAASGGGAGSAADAAARTKEGMKCVRQAAKGGLVAAQAAMGRILLEGLHGQERDVVGAAAWVAAAAEGGDADSQLLYGCMWIDGFMRKLTAPLKEGGVIKAHAGAVVQERDPQVGMEWVRKAAQAGVPEAQFRLGCHLLELAGGSETGLVPLALDDPEALGWIRRAADADHADAAWLLARRLASAATSVATKRGGKGGQRAWAYSAQREACAWLSRAAHLGVAAAEAEYGIFPKP